MSGKDRRKQAKETLRQHILDVAKVIAANDGWQNVTIRKICAQIHYSAPIVYNYFESKEQILEAIRYDGILQIRNQFAEVDKKYKLPEKRILEYAFAWWNFAQMHPELYQVMYNLQGAVCNKSENQQGPAVDFYSSAFAAINQKSKQSIKYQLELCDNLIALIHGFIAMKMVNKIKSGNDKAELVFKNAIKRFIHSIQDIKN